MKKLPDRVREFVKALEAAARADGYCLQLETIMRADVFATIRGIAINNEKFTVCPFVLWLPPNEGAFTPAEAWASIKDAYNREAVVI